MLSLLVACSQCSDCCDALYCGEQLIRLIGSHTTPPPPPLHHPPEKGVNGAFVDQRRPTTQPLSNLIAFIITPKTDNVTFSPSINVSKCLSFARLLVQVCPGCWSRHFCKALPQPHAMGLLWSGCDTSKHLYWQLCAAFIVCLLSFLAEERCHKSCCCCGCNAFVTLR